MKWYNYVACFFAGMFVGNTIPHLIHGISGDAFPTPFANPPGKGLSSPIVNVLWALFNLLVGYLLYRGRGANIAKDNKWALSLFFVGFIVISIMCSYAFVDKVHA